MFLEFCAPYATPEQISPHVREEYVKTICYKQHQTHTFLKKKTTKLLRQYSKIAMFNILKTSLSLKMSDAYISSNDRIITSTRIPYYYSIYPLKTLKTVDLKYLY